MKWDDHNWCLEQLSKAEEADHDNRERARECMLFCDKRDGQWEPHWWESAKNRPRYVFDLVSPIIDQICGDLAKSNFSTNIQPMNGEASEDTADTYDGLIRAIDNISRSDQGYNAATQDCVKGGLSGLRVTQEYVDGDSFDQDLMVHFIPNYIDRVWHGPHTQQDASDAEYAWVLTGLDEESFADQYPDRTPASVEQDRSATAFWNRVDLTMVGEFLYLKTEDREILKLSNGSIVAADEFAPIADEAAANGITVVGSRKRPVKKLFSRLFDANGWIGDERPTVFEHSIPVVPMYGNFSYIEDKIVYRGAVDRLIDPQRVYNYSLSREIEEGALAPRAKYWMTMDQAEGHEDQLETLNTNSDPVQFFNPDQQLPGPPQQQGGAQINPGLRNISQAMQQMVGMAAGMFAANMGDNPGLQSGVAIEALQSTGERGNNKFLTSRIICQEQIARILVDAIPRVYEAQRQVRIIGEDGAQDTVTIGQPVQDEQTGQMVLLNDLSAGKYSIRCESSPSYETRQSETVAAITEVGKIDPAAVQMGSDILFRNIPSPGMDDIAERKRLQLLNAGVIPQAQMTPEELQQLQAAQSQPPQESPEMVLARAEEAKAQADAAAVQQKTQESQQSHQIDMAKLNLEQQSIELEKVKLQIEAAKAGVEIKLKGAQAAKTISEAEAQDVETDAVVSGIADLVRQA